MVCVAVVCVAVVCVAVVCVSVVCVAVIGSRSKCLPVHRTVVETQRYDLVFLPETGGQVNGTVETRYTLEQHQASGRALLCLWHILPW